MVEARVSFPIVPSAPVFNHDQGSLLDRLSGLHMMFLLFVPLAIVLQLVLLQSSEASDFLEVHHVNADSLKIHGLSARSSFYSIHQVSRNLVSFSTVSLRPNNTISVYLANQAFVALRSSSSSLRLLDSISVSAVEETLSLDHNSYVDIIHFFPLTDYPFIDKSVLNYCKNEKSLSDLVDCFIDSQVALRNAIVAVRIVGSQGAVSGF